jgi:hypothetical protein
VKKTSHSLFKSKPFWGKFIASTLLKGNFFKDFFKSRGVLLNERVHKEIKKKIGAVESISIRLSKDGPLNGPDAINFEDLMRKLMAFNAKQRISASQALSHPFFQ